MPATRLSLLRQVRTHAARERIFVDLFGTMPLPCKAFGNDAKAKSLPGWYT